MAAQGHTATEVLQTPRVTQPLEVIQLPRTVQPSGSYSSPRSYSFLRSQGFSGLCDYLKSYSYMEPKAAQHHAASHGRKAAWGSYGRLGSCSFLGSHGYLESYDRLVRSLPGVHAIWSAGDPWSRVRSVIELPRSYGHPASQVHLTGSLGSFQPVLLPLCPG